MRRSWLHLIMVAGWLFIHGEAHGAPRHARKGDVHISCWRALASKPPDRNYSCTVDVLDVADHDRWLVFPYVMEDRLKPVEPVVLIQIDEKDDGLVVFSELGSDVGFHVTLIPAHKQLHIKEWVLWTMEKAEDITVWMGDKLPLSNGESLVAVFKHIEAREPGAGYERGNWNASKGTTVAFDPKGFKTIHLAPLPKRAGWR